MHSINGVKTSLSFFSKIKKSRQTERTIFNSPLYYFFFSSVCRPEEAYFERMSFPLTPLATNTTTRVCALRDTPPPSLRSANHHRHPRKRSARRCVDVNDDPFFVERKRPPIPHDARRNDACRWRRRIDDEALEKTTTTLWMNAVGSPPDGYKERESENNGRRRRRDVVLATTTTMAALIVQPKPDDARAITVFPNLKDSQSTFQLGALRTSAQRLHTLREDIIEKGTVKPGTKEAIERLQNATLDCASARAALEAYSNVRDVCTLSIVLKSVSKRFATEDEKATATRRKEAAVMAYAELERLLKDNEKNASAAHLDEGFDAARDALRQFAESVVDAFAFDESAAKAKREEFPELFFKS